MAISAGRLRAKWELLFGYDLFISYKRTEAAPYARALANELIAHNFTCFFDEEEAPPGYPLTKQIRAALSRTRVLLVIATPGALTSHWVAQEIERFLSQRRRSRRLIVLNIDQTLSCVTPETPVWGPILAQELIWFDVSLAEFSSGAPSADTLRAIHSHFTFARGNNIRRGVTWAVIVLLSVLTGLALWSADTARKRQREAEAASAEARKQTRIAQERTREAIDNLDEALLGYLGLAQQEIKDGDLVGAEEDLEYLVPLAEPLPPDRDPAFALLWGDFATTLFDLGERFRIAGNRQKAMVAYESAGQILERLLRLAGHEAGNPDWKSALTGHVQRMGRRRGQIYVMVEPDSAHSTMPDEWKALLARIEKNRQALTRLKK